METVNYSLTPYPSYSNTGTQHNQVHPKITACSYGKITLECNGKTVQLPLGNDFRSDVILGPNFTRKWEWKNPNGYPVDTSRKYPLSHSPGITLQAIESVVKDLNPTHIILSKGICGQLPCTPRAEAYLQSLQNREVVQLMTCQEQATEDNLSNEGFATGKYNQLIKNPSNRVVAFLHMTC